MTFSDIRQEDCALLAGYYVKTYNAPPWNDQWTEALAAQRLTEIMECRRALGLICRDGDRQVVGAILGTLETGFAGRQFYIQDFFVTPSHQGTGIGSLLLDALEKRLAAMGICGIYLLTATGQRTEHYYQKRGFATSRKIVLMSKHL